MISKKIRDPSNVYEASHTSIKPDETGTYQRGSQTQEPFGGGGSYAGTQTRN